VAFVTNGGGGLSEAEYLRGLKEKILGAASDEDRAAFGSVLDHIEVPSMVLSYTPMGESPEFKDKHLLLVGDPKEMVKEVCPGMVVPYVGYR
jgi:hypothetical protein